MESVGKTVATLLIGAAVGAAVGYVIATDDEKRRADLEKIKDQLNDWSEKVKETAEEMKEKAKTSMEDLKNKTNGSNVEDIEKDIYKV